MAHNLLLSDRVARTWVGQEAVKRACSLQVLMFSWRPGSNGSVPSAMSLEGAYLWLDQNQINEEHNIIVLNVFISKSFAVRTLC